MDVLQSTTPFPGVVVVKNKYFLQYSGSKQALVDGGLLKDGFFPGDTGNNVTVARLESEDVYKTGFSPSEIERITIKRHDGASKLFHVRAYFVSQIVHKNEMEIEIPKAKNKSMELALLWVKALPDSELNFKRRSASLLKSFNSIEFGLLNKRGGYSMTTETIDKFSAAVANLTEVVMSGSVNFSESDHVNERLELTREAFDRHLATCFLESERDMQFEKFKLEVEGKLEIAALTGCIQTRLVNGLVALNI